MLRGIRIALLTISVSALSAVPIIEAEAQPTVCSFSDFGTKA